jgi:RNA recognition motif-containing protein
LRIPEPAKGTFLFAYLSRDHEANATFSFAFVDFASIDNATSTLINPKNHRFNGRELKVEFAGADAVRRGAAKHLLPGSDLKDGKKPFNGKPRGARDSRPPRPSRDASDGARGPKTEFKSNSDYAATPATVGEVGGGEDEQVLPREKRQRPAGSERLGRDGKKRPKPGAALALAKRETAAIVPGQGKKITF